MGFDGNNGRVGDFLDILSIWIGYENLIENREQSAQNDISKHNQIQAKVILDDLHAKFDEQNKLLTKILKLLEKENKENDLQ